MQHKFIIAVLTAICAIFSANAAGNTTFGVQTGYTSTNESAIVGLFLQYRLADNLRIAPAVGGVFRNHNYDAFTFDIDMHYPLSIRTSQAVGLYPLAGINYSSWSYHKTTDSNDVSTRRSKFGLNLGAGFEYIATPTLKIKAEWKYTLTSRFSTTVISAGIGYIF